MDQKIRQPNAKKWTEEIVSEHLLSIRQDAESGGCFFIGRALAHRGLYRDVWKYWKKIFATNDDIMEQMLSIDTLFEANLVESALKKELPARLARLTLCYNYHWNDKPKSVKKALSMLSKICPPPGTYERWVKFGYIS